MEWLEKLKRLMGVPEDDFPDEPDDIGESTESKREQFFAKKYRDEEPSPRYEAKKERDIDRDRSRDRSSYFEKKEPVRREPMGEPRREVRKSRDEKYMNINATAQLQVILVKPEDFREAQQIADHLINKKTVLLNLEGVNREVVRRMIDFLSGCAYAQGGTLKRVANGTFIITPYDVNIMGEVLDELKMDRSVF